MRIRTLLFLCIILSSSGVQALEFDKLAINGFASAGFMKSPDYNYLVPAEKGSFEFNEMGLSFNSTLAEDIRIGIQLFSYDLGEIGKNHVTLDLAFIDYQWKEYLGLKIGKIKTPLGLYNEVQDYDMLRTSIVMPQGVYSRYKRETFISSQGAGIHGIIGLGPIGSIHYDGVIGTGEYEDNGGIAKETEGLFRINGRDLNFESGMIEILYASRLKWNTPFKELLFSISYLGGKTEFIADLQGVGEITDKSDVSIPVYSGELRIGGLTAAIEYYNLTTDHVLQGGGFSFENKQTLESYYGLVSYRFTDLFEAGAYYSVFYNDKDDRDGDSNILLGQPDYYAWQKDIAFSLRFDITDFWLVKLEAHVINGVALAIVDNPDGCEDEDWTLYAVKSTFNF